MNLENTVEAMIAAAKQAGSFIKKEQRLITADKIEEKERNSLVSYVDKQAEQIVVNQLQNIIENAGFITEEETIENLKSENYNWIIDPLDGTTNFIYGLPIFAVSIALEYQGDIIAGVVYEISMDECFYAWKDGGAYLNGKKIQVSSRTQYEQALVATGFPYKDEGNIQHFLLLLADFFKDTRGVRRLGSAATDLAYVACGRFDTFFEYGLSPWDVAGGAIIVSEAGGVLSDFSGDKNYIYGKEIIASQPHLAAQIEEVVQKRMSSF